MNATKAAIEINTTITATAEETMLIFKAGRRKKKHRDRITDSTNEDTKNMLHLSVFNKIR